MILLRIVHLSSVMNYSTGTEGYYRKMLELQEKLRRSEEERMKLEEKFNETMRYTRDAEHERLRVLRHKYHRFLEEDRVRQDRNENILRALDRIESRAKTFAAKTDRFKALRKQYDAYIRRMYTIHHRQPEVDARAQQSSDTHPYQSYPNARKQLFATDVPPATQRSDTKIAMLEQYLQENFNSFPNDRIRGSENQMFSRSNGFTAGYALPEEPSENRNNVGQNYRQSETIVDSDSRHSQEGYNMENGIPSRRSDSRLMQHELECVPKLPVNECPQPKKTDKSELLGNTIEQELDRFRDKKESAKQKTDTEVVNASTPEPYVQNYKDLVSKSAKKFGLHNGSLTKRTSDQNIDSEDEGKISSILKSNDPVCYEAVPDTTVQRREENTVNFAEHPGNEYESPIIPETLKSEDVEIDKEESVCDQQIVSHVKPTDDGVILGVRERDDNVDVRSRTPEVSSARTEPPDDVTLTTPSPIHVPLPAENIATHKQDESLGSDNKKSPVHLDEKLTESAVVQPAGVSKDLQNDDTQDNVIPQLPVTEQSESLNENIVTENQNNYPMQDELKVSENYGEPNRGFDQNSPVEGPLVEQQPGYEGADQPVYDNPEQVYQDEYQPQDEYGPQSYPVQEHVEAQPEVYDAEQYHMDPADQQQYAAAEEHYSVDQKQYPADQEPYGVDQQQCPVDQEQYLVGQQEYPTDQQQYPADLQYAVDEQHYAGTDADQHYPVSQQEYPVDRQDQPYPAVDQQEYPTGHEQYPVDSQQYPEHHQQYVPDEQQYQGEYPPEQYAGEPQQYLEGQPADYDPTQYPPNYGTDQPYPQGEYEAEQYPDGGYSQDVYRSEQEYLQGEQNIDLQYQTEVTGQEYPGEFANQENQPQLQQAGAVEQDHQPQQSISPQQSSSEPGQRQVQQDTSLPAQQDVSESLGKSATKNVIQPADGPLVEKKLPNLADMLDTDTESTKQETKVSNDSDFDFSK